MSGSEFVNVRAFILKIYGQSYGSDERKSKYPANSKLACRHRPVRNGFLVQGPPKEPGVASLASKRVHEN